MDPKSLELISVILAVASGCGPLFFGFLMFKMSKTFLTREEFDAYKTVATREREEIKEAFKSMRSDISELLQRTARLLARADHK